MVPYLAWIILFVIAPLILILYQSLTNNQGQWTLQNFQTYATSWTYLKMTLNSFWYALLITAVTLLISYPTAYILSKMKRQQLWLLLIILPTWINLLLKTYAFIGLLSRTGTVNQFLAFIGIGPRQLLFSDFSFLLVASYIEIPFMILPIYNAIVQLDPALVNASRDLGATNFQTFTKVVFPLTISGVKAGIQAVFIPSLSLFMITRLIGGNRVITLGTAIEEHFLTTMNWGMGSTIGVVLIVMMFIMMMLTNDRKKKRQEVLPNEEKTN
ncbi:spermidine putrescine ABC transporter permease [Lapidilactobacillus concavus DSM 17758]|jgi:spermidine/putrescine transport system permease protein|uniref:Spermidine putrescine ABC transporter permease n=1 Tax=Lapidilactobacillus concavus DSM 17758 TaxID=1423735 RepID=A0A0R1W7W2_9LACO|nr:ABC transporter permease [Lapidilactobacillus concavus]KRM13693.1 spermidine putrescine ABC transporter permease [Lapidilactobacillus concavus DSM 17758]